MREKKMKDQELKREKSKNKIQLKKEEGNIKEENINRKASNVGKGEDRVKVKISRANTAKSIDEPSKRSVSRSKSPVNIKQDNVFSYIIQSRRRVTDKQSEESSRAPIKIIKREEAIIANKKVKNINYTKLSNKKTTKSAINTVCLAGEPNRVCREKILEIIEKCPCENFVILFKGNFGRFV